MLNKSFPWPNNYALDPIFPICHPKFIKMTLFPLNEDPMIPNWENRRLNEQRLINLSGVIDF